MTTMTKQDKYQGFLYRLVLLLLLMIVGYGEVLATSTDVYKRGDGTGTSWSASDISGETAWTANTAGTAFVVQGSPAVLYMSGGNASYEYQKALKINPNAKLTITGKWNTGSSLGRDAAYNYLRFGNVELRAYGQGEKGSIVINGEETILTTSTGDVRDNKDWSFTITVTQTTGAVTYSVTMPTAGTKAGSGNVGVLDFSAIKMGYLKTGSNYDTHQTLKWISISQETYAYTVNATGSLDQEIASGSDGPGASLTIPYHRYILSGSTLHKAERQGSDPHYGVKFTLDVDNKSVNIAYTNFATNVAVFREAEDFMTEANNSYVNIRCSNQLGGYSSTAKTVASLPKGAYTITAASYGRPTNFVFSSGGADKWTHSASAWGENTSGIVQLAEGALQVRGGSSSYALDYVYVTRVFAFEEASSDRTKGSTAKPTLINARSASVSYKSSNEFVATVNGSGDVSFHHNGTAIITATATIDAVEYTTTHTVTVTGETEVSISPSYDSGTKTETYTLSGTGYVGQTVNGTLVTMSYGSATETQTVDNGHASCIDANGFTHVFLNANENATGIPTMGTYYTFVPKQNGTLTINAMVSENIGNRNGLRLVDGDGNILERITSIGTSYQNYAFNTLLIKGRTYYVFAETGAMKSDERLNAAYSTLWLSGFTFTQMSGETISFIDQSLLFFPGENANNERMNRTIPKFNIVCKGKNGVTYKAGELEIKNGNAEDNENNGEIIITPRIKAGESATFSFSSVTLNIGSKATNSPQVSVNDGTPLTIVANQNITFGSLTGDELKIKLNSYGTSNGHYLFRLNSITFVYSIDDESKLDGSLGAVDLRLQNTDYLYGYEGDDVEDAVHFESPNAFYGNVEFDYTNGFATANEPLTKTLIDTRKTYFKNGDDQFKVRIGQGTGTLTATYAGSDYFAPSSATTRLYSRDYEESKTLAADGSYTVPAGAGATITVTTSTSESATVTLTNTGEVTTTLVKDGDVFKEKAFSATVSGTTGATQAVTITNTTGEEITVKIKVARKSATLDFSYNGAVGAGSDVLFTSWNYTPNTFTISSETETGIADKYDETTATYAITQPVSGVEINSSGALTVGAEADNGLLQVTLTVNPKEENKELYAPLTKTITLKVVDGMWDFRTYSRAEHYTMYNSTGWSGQEGGWYAGRDNAEFADILRKDNTPLPRVLSLQTMGKHRLLHSNHGFLHLQGRGVGVNESPYGGGQLRIPAKAGMLVEVNCLSEDILSEMEIEGVTDLDGHDVTYFYVNNDDTESQYFLAKSDGYIVVRNPSVNLDLHIRYIRVSADMAFEYGNETYIDASVGTWSNPVMNQGTTTISYAFTNDNSTPVSSINSSTGEVTIGSGQYGKFTVTATGSGTGVLAGKSGSYIAYSIGVTRNSTSSSVAISGTPAEFTLKNLFDIAVGGTGLTESDLKDKIVFNVVTPSPTVTLDGGILTVEGVQEVSLTATLGAITIPFTCEVTGGKLTGGLNPVIANDAESYTITIEGESDHKFNLKAMYDGIMGDIKDSKTSLVFKNVDNPESPVVLSVDATEVSCSNLCIEGFSTIKKGGVIPIYAGYTHSTTPCPIEGTLTVAYTKHTWDFTSNLIPNLAKWKTNNVEGSYTIKTNTWGTGATIDEPVDAETNHSYTHDWRFRRKIPGKTDGAIVYYYNHSVEGQNALVIPETEGLHVFASPSNQQLGVEMMQDGGVATVPYDCRNLMLLRGGKVTIPKLEKGQWVEVRWTRHKEEMGERILMTNLSDVAGTEITSTYKIGNCFYNLDWSTSTYMFQATEDGDVTFEVADNIYVSIQEIILHEPGWTFQSNFADKLRGYDDISYDKTIDNVDNPLYQKKYKDYTDVEKSSWTGATAPQIDWQYIWDDQGSHTITFLSKEYQNAPNAPQTWKFEMDEMLTRSGAVMTTSSTDGGEATLTYNGGWGKVKVTMTSYSQNMKYVANQKSWTITFGQAPKQTYPYTWDFTKFFTDTPSAMLNDKTWAAVDYSGSSNPLHVAIYNNNTTTNYGGTANGGWSNTYDMADYQSYYVEGAQLVCYGLRGTNNGVIRETAGLGFKLDTSGDGKPEENMLMLNMTNTVPEARAAVNRQTWNTITAEGHETESHLTIATGGKVIVPKPNDDTHNYYIYIRSSHEPSAYNNVKKMVESSPEANEELDDNYDVPTGVYKYRFSANKNAEFTFTSTDEAVDSKLQSYADPASPVGRKYTDIYAIAVTKDFKTLKKLSGTGWATESRDYAVDYTLDSLLTTRPLQAFSVIARSTNPLYSEEKTKTTVRLQDRNYVVPDRQGLVLKQVTGAPGADGSIYEVPLFVPAVTTAVEPTYAYTNNLMRPNLTGEAPGTTNDPQTFTSETETINDVDYTRFILSEKYLTWKKDGETGNVTANDNFSQGAVPGFFRLHVFEDIDYDDTDNSSETNGFDHLTGTNRNTLGENKAYLLLRTDRINAPIWTSGAPVRRFDFVGIESVSDIYDWNDESNDKIANDEDAPIFNLNGQPMGNDKSVLAPGIYIRNGKKFVVR